MLKPTHPEDLMAVLFRVEKRPIRFSIRGAPETSDAGGRSASPLATEMARVPSSDFVTGQVGRSNCLQVMATANYYCAEIRFLSR